MNGFIYSDFRTTALAHFRLLSSLCELANDTLNNAKNSFLSNKLLSTKIISYEGSINQIQVAIELFQLNAHSTFIQTLRLTSATISANALITIYSTSWKFVVNEVLEGAILPTQPMTYNHENGTCSCGISSDCSQPASIYENNTEIMFIPGIRVFNISTSFFALNNQNQSKF